MLIELLDRLRIRLWAIAARAYPRYDGMAEEARPREIPLVRLRPRVISR